MHGSEIVMPDWILPAFSFLVGACVGSFLNVVIYRIPRDKSLVMPPSSCPSCGKHIRFYDNIPLVSWLFLLGKCRYCRVRISPRYFVIELLTGLVFLGVFWLYFQSGLRVGIPPFFAGGWFLYLVTLILLSALTAASAIDLEMWIIPLSICWFATAAGFIASALAPLVIHPATIRHYFLTPTTEDLIIVNPVTLASLTAGAVIGLGLSLILLAAGIIKRSYDISQLQTAPQNTGKSGTQSSGPDEFNDRAEMLKEIVFLLPIVICAVAADKLINQFPALHQRWVDFSQMPVVAGLMGSIFGYLVGCAIVWATRILGTLAFGREAMGLGDVHLMGAAGAVVGPLFVIIAFFIAPFFGLGWAALQMFFKKTRQIPYGPFLSMGILAVMILHDRIMAYLSVMFYW
jgi:leader peptidase (prepilin peptidase) / N-methyltransferase